MKDCYPDQPSVKTHTSSIFDTEKLLLNLLVLQMACKADQHTGLDVGLVDRQLGIV